MPIVMVAGASLLDAWMPLPLETDAISAPWPRDPVPHCLLTIASPWRLQNPCRRG